MSRTYAIGSEGGVPRMYVTVNDPSKARGQCAPNETFWEVEAVPVEPLHFNPRERRDRLLLESDWTQLPDSPLDAEQRERWREYRQALRDLDVNGAAWPEPPIQDAAASQ